MALNMQVVEHHESFLLEKVGRRKMRIIVLLLSGMAQAGAYYVRLGAVWKFMNP